MLLLVQKRKFSTSKKKKKKLKGQGKKQKTVKESRERLKAVLFLARFDVRELID